VIMCVPATTASPVSAGPGMTGLHDLASDPIVYPPANYSNPTVTAPPPGSPFGDAPRSGGSRSACPRSSLPA
ncbi:MAG: hypothetical protein ACREC5_04205, partial [Thermoplasmata archaeon]